MMVCGGTGAMLSLVLTVRMWWMTGHSQLAGVVGYQEAILHKVTLFKGVLMPILSTMSQRRILGIFLPTIAMMKGRAMNGFYLKEQMIRMLR